MLQLALARAGMTAVNLKQNADPAYLRNVMSSVKPSALFVSLDALEGDKVDEVLTATFPEVGSSRPSSPTA